MSKPVVSILTDPVPRGSFLPREIIRRMVSNFQYMLKGNEHANQYRGHPAVTRSLIQGLKILGISFTNNPWSISNLSETVVVLSSVRALSQALSLKAEGRIKFVAAGPNIVENPNDSDAIICHPLVDLVITPSEWVRKYYESENPTLIGRCAAWPAGINIHEWTPSRLRERNHVLIYDKSLGRSQAGVISQIESVLDLNGITHRRITYGSYSQKDYFQLLNTTTYMIYVSDSESQGLALLEAWAMDVPTLVLSKQNVIHRNKNVESSNAPYLCDQNGLVFTSVGSLTNALDTANHMDEDFEPRSWVKANLTLEISTKVLLEQLDI